MGDEVVVVPYRESWPAEFAAERARVAAVLGARAAGIEHIGSTAVAGLSAKPVIDLLVGAATRDAFEACVELLVAAGWDYPEELNAKIEADRRARNVEGRRFLRKLEGGVRTHHLHVVVHQGVLWTEYLLFRDQLRKAPSLAREYEELKRDLAEKYRDQRERYTESKTSFVARVLAMPPPSAR